MILGEQVELMKESREEWQQFVDKYNERNMKIQLNKQEDKKND